MRKPKTANRVKPKRKQKIVLKKKRNGEPTWFERFENRLRRRLIVKVFSIGAWAILLSYLGIEQNGVLFSSVLFGTFLVTVSFAV